MRKIAFLSAFLLALFVLSAPTTAFAQVGVTVAFGPPPLPVYEQPVCPGEGYIWTPWRCDAFSSDVMKTKKACLQEG